MSLFDSDDVTGFVPAHHAKGVRVKVGANSFAVGRKQSVCADVIGRIEKNTQVHYVSMGQWSVRELLLHVVQQIGPCSLSFATFSITPEAVKTLIDLLEQSVLTQVNAILDYRVKTHNPEAHQLAHYNLNNVGLHSCHAKVYVLHNDNYSVTIIGSPNLTNNPRIETGMVIESPEVAAFHTNWIAEMLSTAKTFS